MKILKKTLALLLVAMLVLSLSSTAFAASINVENVVDGETYDAYKILNYTNSGTAYSYYLTDTEYAAIGSVLEAAGFHFTASADGSQYVVDNGGTLDAAAAAEYLGAHVADLGNALGKFTTTGASGEANFTGLGTGYYFVTSTTGSLCALHSDTAIATAVEKNSIPGVDKKEGTTEGTYADGPIDANIGDPVYYQIEVTDGVGTNSDITLTDTLSEGLTYTAGSIKINGTAVADNANEANYSVTVSGQTITIVLKDSYVASLAKDAKVTITYQATINDKAVVNSATGNENKIELDYSSQHVEDKVYVETYDVTLKKTDGSANALAGAKFKLYTAETGGTALKFKSDSTGYYLDAAGEEELDAGDGTGVNIRGLEPGTYWFEETVAPNGYNKLHERKSVTVTTGQTAAAEIIVVNQAGAELPSTGGIGTTIFYVVGGVLVAAALVMLITKKRMSTEG